MVNNILVIGASGIVGSQVVKQLDASNSDANIRLGTSQSSVAEKWKVEGREAVMLDLSRPEANLESLRGVDRLFLLTTYSAAMLYQSKMLVDAAVKAGVSHIVHLGVFSSGSDLIPHFAWHDLIETYIKASGIAWTNLHPNVIADTLLIRDPPVRETGSFQVMWGEAAYGWVSAADIAAVAARVLIEGPAKHGGKDYGLSPEVVTGPEVATILSEALGKPVKCEVGSPDDLEGYISSIPDAGTRLYLESAVQVMRLGKEGQMKHQATRQDDVETVLGRPATSLKDWAREHLGASSV